MKEDIVYLTFPTTKSTAHTLTRLANLEGKTQPRLLDEMCQEFIQNKLISIIVNLESKGIDVSELIKENEQKSSSDQAT